VNQDRDEAAQEFMEEIVDDLGYEPRGAKTQNSGATLAGRPPKKLLIPGAIGALILIVVVFFLMAGGSGSGEEDIASLQAGLTRIENQLSRLEGLEERIVQLEESEKKLLQRIRRMAEGTARTAPKKRTAAAQSQARYHTVKPGESLYTIAKKYGLSTERLCQLNRLSETKPIQPGQKLRVEG